MSVYADIRTKIKAEIHMVIANETKRTGKKMWEVIEELLEAGIRVKNLNVNCHGSDWVTDVAILSEFVFSQEKRSFKVSDFYRDYLLWFSQKYKDHRPLSQVGSTHT